MAEHRSVWDRRVPLTPKDIKFLISQNKNLRFIIQPSKTRIFKNSEYEEIGAEISDNLEKCSLILGVRAVALEAYLPKKTYMFFGHFLKAQTHNLPFLDKILEQKIRFIDYEKITNNECKRLVYFGRIAGIAATIDFLAGLGNLFLKRGISSPLLTVSYGYRYESLEDAKENIIKISKILQYNGMPKELSPIVFALTGRGKTSEGVAEILKLLPIKEIPPEELPALFQNKNDPALSQYIYLCYIDQQHMVEKAPEGEHQAHDHIIFNKHDYYKHPMKYRPIFHEKYLPYISVIFNCLYWDQRYPRLIEDEQMKTLCLEGKSRLLGVCDIACDLEGSIEFLKKYTDEDNHFYTYDPVKSKIVDDIHNIPNGVIYQAIDAISRELSFDASTEFSKSLLPFIEKTALSDINKPMEEQNLQKEIFEATITWNGNYTPNFHYLDALRKTTFSSNNPKKLKRNNSFIEVELIGHLFDTYAINDVMELLRHENDVSFNFYPYLIGRDRNETTRAQLLINGEDNEKCDVMLEKIQTICKEKGIEMNLI